MISFEFLCDIVYTACQLDDTLNDYDGLFYKMGRRQVDSVWVYFAISSVSLHNSIHKFSFYCSPYCNFRTFHRALWSQCCNVALSQYWFWFIASVISSYKIPKNMSVYLVSVAIFENNPVVSFCNLASGFCLAPAFIRNFLKKSRVSC